MRHPRPAAAVCLASVLLVGASGAQRFRHGADLVVVLNDIGSALFRTPVRVYYSDY